MDLIWILLIGFLGLVGASLSKILADEFKAWSPSIARYFVRLAVSRLRDEDKDRYFEEWSHEVTQVPGDLGKILFSIDLIRAALKMSEVPVFHFAAKRLLDILMSGVGLTVLFPILAVIGAAIRLDSRGPIIVREPRIGRGGRTFNAFKFRTCRVEVQLNNEPDGQLSPITTRTGRFLWTTNLDELPQLFNILKGDMSLVGPRCHRPGMLAAGVPYEELVSNYHKRHEVRPGLTGLAQLAGYRGPTHHEGRARERIARDLQYIQEFSIWLDIKILVATVIAELKGGTGF